jgi:GcrA cell cycle regulator
MRGRSLIDSRRLNLLSSEVEPVPEMSWTDERVEALRVMWTDGKSASQIAKELGGVTRNAVIGKVHRLGLSNRVGGADREEENGTPEPVVDGPEPEHAPEAPAAPPAAPRPAGKDPAPPARPKPPGQIVPPQPAPSEISAEALANLAEVAKKARRLSLMQLSERTCKWPVGDPATDDFWFCGLPTVPGKPYCDTHVAVAFQPMSARRDRRAGGR